MNVKKRGRIEYCRVLLSMRGIIVGFDGISDEIEREGIRGCTNIGSSGQPPVGEFVCTQEKKRHCK